MERGQPCPQKMGKSCPRLADKPVRAPRRVVESEAKPVKLASTQ